SSQVTLMWWRLDRYAPRRLRRASASGSESAYEKSISISAFAGCTTSWRCGLAARAPVERAALVVGQLVLAGLERRMRGRAHHAVANHGRPTAIAARLLERVAHRRELIEDRASGRRIDGGLVELFACGRDEPARDGVA